MELVVPGAAHVPSYRDALQRGWSPDILRPSLAATDLARLAEDEAAFLASFDDREGRGGPIVLPDGSTAKRLPGIRWWMWDGEFCGTIGFRWQPGTPDLPPHCLGHIGYNVVPWKRRLGYATRALQLALPHAAATGLPYVDLTTDLDNTGSQKVIVANGGRLVEQFTKPQAYGGSEGLLYRIDLR